MGGSWRAEGPWRSVWRAVESLAVFAEDRRAAMVSLEGNDGLRRFWEETMRRAEG
jgi:hypothetical protein